VCVCTRAHASLSLREKDKDTLLEILRICSLHFAFLLNFMCCICIDFENQSENAFADCSVKNG
jgi:hypothetical protein